MMRALDLDADSRMENEVEPDFDPKQFDITTGSIPDLPRPRGESAPARSFDAPAAEPRPAARRAAPARPAVMIESPKGN